MHLIFAAFFGALFYARQLSVPWLGGADNNIYTPELWKATPSAIVATNQPMIWLR
jgi:cytochrome c oxidase subunit 3